MDLFRRYGNLLKSDGTNQLQRTLPALEHDYIRPDERSLSDLVEYARQLASEICYYNGTGQAVGDWSAFFEEFVDPLSGRTRPVDELDAVLAARKDHSPHKALFIVFLRLFEVLQKDLNELPARHLSHYYEQELHLLRSDAVADEAHVIFELARNASPTLLKEGVLLDAGKDAQGRPLNYALDSEQVISAATVADIRRFVAEKDRRGNRKFFTADAISETEADDWATFGRSPLSEDATARFMSDAKMGFAIGSPTLVLGEGERDISIAASLRAVSGTLPRPQNLSRAIEVSLSGEEGWFSPDLASARLVEDPITGNVSMLLDLHVSALAPAIVPFDRELHEQGPESGWPVMRCVVRNDRGQHDVLEGLEVDRIDISADVKGVTNFVVQNDQGALSADQPMPLFGAQPHLGSNFYIGSREVFNKRLTSLDLHLEWQDTPEDFFDHYEAYFVFADTALSDPFNSRFLIRIEMLYERSWNHQLLANQSLFGHPDLATRTISAVKTDIDNAFSGQSYEAKPQIEPIDRLSPRSKDGFIRLVLTHPRYDSSTYIDNQPFEAFGHQLFPQRNATQTLALATWDGTGVEPKLPNPPHSPMLASLSVDYRTEASMDPVDIKTEDEFFTLDPWGYTRATDTASARLVPEIDGVAALFLGLDKMQPPGNVSLLFQIERGTAEFGDVLKTGETRWSYLSGSEWTDVPAAAVLRDDTLGFQQPGIVTLSVGADASLGHTTMPPDLVWLRATIDKPPESAARTSKLHAQAGRARFKPVVDELNDYATHLEGRLPAESIKRLKTRSAAIKKTTQPYASFSGRRRESDESFFQRCSERLRHRRRAVTGWDFERLVLEAFPDVFKVKCLPHSDADGNPSAGEVALVIVPDLRSTLSSNPFQPRAGAVLMQKISDLVRTDLATDFARIHVIHPVYESILVDAQVAFKEGLDPGYYATKLNDDLRRFLSPWAFDEGQDISFGARIYKSEILAFLEFLDYVDIVTDFNLYHRFEGPARFGIGFMEIGLDFYIRPEPVPTIGGMTIQDDFIVGTGIEVAATTLPHAILVSAPFHRITPIGAGDAVCTGVDQLGIGYMTIGLDFDIQVT